MTIRSDIVQSLDELVRSVRGNGLGQSYPDRYNVFHHCMLCLDVGKQLGKSKRVQLEAAITSIYGGDGGLALVGLPPATRAEKKEAECLRGLVSALERKAFRKQDSPELQLLSPSMIAKYVQRIRRSGGWHVRVEFIDKVRDYVQAIRDEMTPVEEGAAL